MESCSSDQLIINDYETTQYCFGIAISCACYMSGDQYLHVGPSYLSIADKDMTFLDLLVPEIGTSNLEVASQLPTIWKL